MSTGETNRTTTIRRAVAIIISAAVLAVLASAGESYYQRKQAETLIERLSRVQVGSTPQSLVQEETKPFSRFAEHTRQSDQFTFRNRGLALLHLAPHKFVWITVEYGNGVAVKKSVQYFEEPRSSAAVIETSESDAFGHERQSRDIAVVGRFPSPVGWITVTNTPSAPRSQRELDWNIDLSCMTALGGCRDPRKVLRAVQIPDSPPAIEIKIHEQR